MRVYLGTDHAGFDLKNHLARHLAEQGHEVVDLGAHSNDPADDYPVYCIETARRVVAEPGSVGIVLGGSGNGEQMAANKVAGARAALAWSIESAELARQHNHAQIIGIGARMHGSAEAAAMVDAFLAASPEDDPRHVRRLSQIRAYERSGETPHVPAQSP